MRFNVVETFFLVAIIIAVFIFFQKKQQTISPKYYFAEEAHLLQKEKLKSYKTNFYLYTIAEFSEVSSVNENGIVKELGFSDFILIYDKINDVFMSARVRFIGADGYDRSEKIGFYKFLSDDKDWIELNIRLPLNDYNQFIADLKESAQDRKTTAKNTFFLYDLSGYHAYGIGDDCMVYYIDLIKKIGTYDSYYADKIGLMSTLQSTPSQLDERQSVLRREIMNRFNEINS